MVNGCFSPSVVATGMWFALLVTIVNREIHGGSMTWSMAVLAHLW